MAVHMRAEWSSPGLLAHYYSRVSPITRSPRYAMREVVIVDSVRTGLAKSFRGKFNMTRPDDMAAHCVNALLSRNDLDPKLVDDCIVGAGSNEGAQGYNIGRNVAVLSQLGIDCPGMTLNRYCSSGLQAIRSEEHTSELQSRENLVCRLL